MCHLLESCKTVKDLYSGMLVNSYLRARLHVRVPIWLSGGPLSLSEGSLCVSLPSLTLSISLCLLSSLSLYLSPYFSLSLCLSPCLSLSVYLSPSLSVFFALFPCALHCITYMALYYIELPYIAGRCALGAAQQRDFEGPAAAQQPRESLAHPPALQTAFFV